jgi:hypothetical protein
MNGVEKMRSEDLAAAVEGEMTGDVTWHCSEEDGSPDVGKSITLPDGGQLWFGEISRSLWEEAGEDAVAIGPDFGWWIIHYSKTETTVIGKCLNADTANALVEVLSAALRRPS